MADDREVQQLIFELIGESKLREFVKELEKEKEAVRAASAELRKGKITLDEFSEQAGASALKIMGLNQQIKGLGPVSAGNSQALLQFQYILDDLVNTSGGFERKLAAISNNIPGFVQSIAGEGSAGIAGAVGIVTTALIALAPLAKAAWDALAGEDSAEKAKERIEEVRRAIADAHKEFEKLANAPNDAEKLSAEGIALFLKQRPNAQRARDVVAAGLPADEVLAGLPEDERARLMGLLKAADRTDEDLRTEAQQATATAEGIGDAARAKLWFEALVRERKEARTKMEMALRQGRQQAAERVIQGALTPGPAGFLDRERLLRLTNGRPGFKELQGLSPEAIEAAERDYEENVAPRADEIEESGRALSRQSRKRRAAEKRRNAEQNHRNRERTDAILHGHAQQIREHKQAQAAQARMEDANARADERDDAANLRDWQRSKKERPFRAARAAVIDVAHANDLGDPTAEQADDMAREALQDMANGMTAQAAAWMAVRHKVQQISAAAARFNQAMQTQNSQMMMGSDHSGQFPMMPGVY